MYRYTVYMYGMYMYVYTSAVGVFEYMSFYHARFCHPNLVPLMGYCIEPPSLVCPYMARLSLYHCLHNYKVLLCCMCVLVFIYMYTYFVIYVYTVYMC